MAYFSLVGRAEPYLGRRFKNWCCRLADYERYWFHDCIRLIFCFPGCVPTCMFLLVIVLFLLLHTSLSLSIYLFIFLSVCPFFSVFVQVVYPSLPAFCIHLSFSFFWCVCVDPFSLLIHPSGQKFGHSSSLNLTHCETAQSPAAYQRGWSGHEENFQYLNSEIALQHALTNSKCFSLLLLFK